MATKFAPLPWRLSATSVEDALRASLARLSLPKAQLYMVHWPGLANDAYIEGLMRCYLKGADPSDLPRPIFSKETTSFRACSAPVMRFEH